MASKGKSTIDVEVDTSALSSLVELAEKYRSILEESNKLLRANVDITKQAGSAQERLNRTTGEGRRSTRANRKQEQAEEDIFPEGKRYRAPSGAFTKRPTWSQSGESGSSGRFSSGWAKAPTPGSLSDMDRLLWGPGKDNTGSGQFKATFGKIGKSFDDFKKSNDKSNDAFYQMFSSGRIGQNLLRNMFSGNLIKMLGIGGTIAAAAYAVSEGAAIGASQRRQALGIGGNVGRMKGAQVELAQFGDVDAGLAAANRAKRMIGPEFSAYRFMGFSADEIKNMDPSTMYAQLQLRSQQKLKGYNPQSMGNLFESQQLGTILPGGINQATTLLKTPESEVRQRVEAAEADAKDLDLTEKQVVALTNLNIALNKAGADIQNIMIRNLATMAPYMEKFSNWITDFVVNTIPHEPAGLIKKDAKSGISDFIIPFVKMNQWIDNLFGGNDNGKTAPAVPSTGVDGKLRKVPNLHSPLNNPPLESNVQGSGAIDEGGGGVLGGVTRVSIFSPKIAKLNKDVTDTSRSLAEFNEQLLKGTQIMVSGAYLAGRQATKDAAAGGTGSIAGGVNIGGGGGFGTTGGAGIYHSGGMGAAGGPTEVSRSGGVVSGVTQVAKGALAKNQQEMYNAAIAEGLSPTAARALVANSSGESLKNPADVHSDPSKRNPNQMAHGIASWDDERSARIMKQFGKMPQDMSVAEQTKAMIWEQKNFYPKTWQALSGGGTAESMTGTLVSDFERPGNVAQATSQRLGYLKGFTPGGGGDGKAITGGGGSSGGGGASGNWGIKDSDDLLGHLQTMKQKGMITGDQCVSLAMASVGVPYAGGAAGGHTGDWRRGESAEAGNLVKGTPVSTFAGLNGEQNQNIYAGGTGGRMKAGLDHAAVFETYVKNKDGKITGMVVDEQYVGSKGVHPHQYDFGGGYGEHDARNYSAIDVAAGGHLGGSNNPLTQRDAAREASTRTASRSGPHPHIGDMSQYHTNQAIKVNVNNPAGADVIAQTSMLGTPQGNYG
jgi:tail lysozyme